MDMMEKAIELKHLLCIHDETNKKIQQLGKKITFFLIIIHYLLANYSWTISVIMKKLLKNYNMFLNCMSSLMFMHVSVCPVALLALM